MNFEEILSAIWNDRATHSRKSRDYAYMKIELKRIMEEVYSVNCPQKYVFPKAGEIKMPYHSMGNIDTVNLFDLDELIIFTIYLKRAGSIRTALDIGANMGLHSIFLAKLGVRVKSFEPDPDHYSLLIRNIKLNNVSEEIIAIQAAVSACSGKSEFTRVLGNTTGSHLTGAKEGAYGELERFEVDVVSIADHVKDVDIVKLDAEGEERRIISKICEVGWGKFDIIAEIGSMENADNLFSCLSDADVKIFTQLSGWERITTVDQMPMSYKDGSVYLTKESTLPW